MKTRQDYINAQAKRCRTEWFKDHKLTPGLRTVASELYLWANPHSSNYWMKAILCGNFLIIIGDINDAVYAWNEKIDMKFLASIDFGYFESKLRASEKGREWRVWEPRISPILFKETVQHLGIETFNMPHIQDYDQSEAEQAAHDYYEKTGDAECAAMLREGPMVPCPRLIGHFVGLQMICEQLNPPVSNV